MRVSGFWSAVGLIITGLIVGDLVLHPQGTSAAFTGITGLKEHRQSALGKPG